MNKLQCSEIMKKLACREETHLAEAVFKRFPHLVLKLLKKYERVKYYRSVRCYK